MIVRIWHGKTKAEHADEYVDYVNSTGVQQQRRTPGNLGSMLLRRVADGEAHFLVVSLWESMAAIEAFAGDRPEVAVYYPEDESYLLELEPEVLHWEAPISALDPALLASTEPASAP